MPQIWLDDRLCERGDLPDICLKCGEPTTDRKSKTFGWIPPATYIALLFGGLGVIIFLILAAVLRKTVHAQVPMCERHRNHWLFRTLLIVGGLVVGIGLIILSVALGDSLPPGDERGILMLVGILGPIVGWIILAIVVSVTAIRALEIRPERGLKLGGVHQDFIDAYQRDFERGLSGPLDRGAMERWQERGRTRPSGPGGNRYRGEDEEDDRRRSSRDRYRDDY
jgi:hypothetical protein